jgi:hypothetical protein
MGSQPLDGEGPGYMVQLGGKNAVSRAANFAVLWR